jgi:membrane protease subunit HflC
MLKLNDKSLVASLTRYVTARRTVILRGLVASLILALAAVQGLYFQITEGKAAVVTRLGRPIREVKEAGPYFRLPWPIDEVFEIDMRKRIYNTPFLETLTRDKKSVVLVTYAIWRVGEPLKFLQAVGSIEAADRKLDGMILAAKNFCMGQYDLSALVSTNESDIKTLEMEKLILDQVKDKASEKLGIKVEQIAFKRIAFPIENASAVIEHMRSQRQVEADRLRAEGERAAQAVKNETLVQTELILREGREEAGRIRGEGEKTAAKIYADSYRKNPEFYKFWRSLEGMKKSLSNGKATLVLRSDQGVFSSLSDSDKNE